MGGDRRCAFDALVSTGGLILAAVLIAAGALLLWANTKLADTVQTVFRGETLRGLLLNAYAFGPMATIAFWGAIASFAGAGIMLLLAILGFLRLRRVPPGSEIFPESRKRASAGTR